MCTFIDDYLSDPTKAVSSACEQLSHKSWFNAFDEDKIYEELASPEFHLYEEMIMSESKETTPHIRGYAVVA